MSVRPLRNTNTAPSGAGAALPRKANDDDLVELRKGAGAPPSRRPSASSSQEHLSSSCPGGAAADGAAPAGERPAGIELPSPSAAAALAPDARSPGTPNPPIVLSRTVQPTGRAAPDLPSLRTKPSDFANGGDNDENIVACLAAMVPELDFESATVNSVRRRLEAVLSADLSGRKTFLRAALRDALQHQGAFEEVCTKGDVYAFKRELGRRMAVAQSAERAVRAAEGARQWNNATSFAEGPNGEMVAVPQAEAPAISPAQRSNSPAQAPAQTSTPTGTYPAEGEQLPSTGRERLGSGDESGAAVAGTDTPKLCVVCETRPRNASHRECAECRRPVMRVRARKLTVDAVAYVKGKLRAGVALESIARARPSTAANANACGATAGTQANVTRPTAPRETPEAASAQAAAKTTFNPADWVDLRRSGRSRRRTKVFNMTRSGGVNEVPLHLRPSATSHAAVKQRSPSPPPPGVRRLKREPDTVAPAAARAPKRRNLCDTARDDDDALTPRGQRSAPGWPVVTIASPSAVASKLPRNDGTSPVAHASPPTPRPHHDADAPVPPVPEQAPEPPAAAPPPAPAGPQEGSTPALRIGSSEVLELLKSFHAVSTDLCTEAQAEGQRVSEAARTPLRAHQARLCKCIAKLLEAPGAEEMPWGTLTVRDAVASVQLAEEVVAAASAAECMMAHAQRARKAALDTLGGMLPFVRDA